MTSRSKYILYHKKAKKMSVAKFAVVTVSSDLNAAVNLMQCMMLKK